MNDMIYHALCGALDHLSAAVLILTPHGFILFANQAAKSMLDEGKVIRSTEGCLQLKERSLGKELYHGIEAVLSGALKGDEDASGYELCLAHSPREATGAVGYLRLLSRSNDAAPMLALFITRVGEAATCSVSALAESFGLSRAEGRVLEQLIEAQTPSAAAARLNLSIYTVKSHMRKIFQKTHTARQSDLLRLVERCRLPLRRPRLPKDLC